jgi:hypothetical protein
MRQFEIEAWALRVCDRLSQGQPFEDSRVELKSEWPVPEKTARQIAGHANAGRGETILWLIGLDERRGVIGAANREVSDWWAKVISCFESKPPTLQNINVDWDKKAIVALCFGCSDFPYVVKNQAFGGLEGGPVRAEVPWHEGNSTRTATRGDLVLMLSPLSRLPKVELLGGYVELHTPSSSGLPVFNFELTAYVVPLDTVPCYFPFHRCTAELLSGASLVADSFAIRMDTRRDRRERMTRERERLVDMLREQESVSVALKTVTHAVEVTEDELQLRGAGKVILIGASAPATTFRGEDEFTLCFRLVEAVTELPIFVRGSFTRAIALPAESQQNKWVFTS